MAEVCRLFAAYYLALRVYSGQMSVSYINRNTYA